MMGRVLPPPDDPDHADALHRMSALPAYYRWTLELSHEAIGNRVLDAGCGFGSFSRLLAEAGHEVTAVDITPRHVEAASRQLDTFPQCRAMQTDITELAHSIEEPYDTVVSLDVIEHLADDVAFLTAARELVSPGGTLILKVPALPFLYGPIDRASGHFRRYTRTTLTRAARAGGWRVESCTYMNLAGVLPYFVKSRILRREANFSRTFTARQLRQINRILPALQLADLLPVPLGQSLVLIGRAG